MAAAAGDSVSAEIQAISDSVRRALECPICLQLTPDMTCPCPNGHPVCYACAIKLWKPDVTNRCPMCRSPMSPNTGGRGSATVVKLAQITAAIKVACAYHLFGCDQLIAIRDVTDHEQSCAHKPNLQCRVSGCQWLGVYNQLFNHVLGNHPSAVVDTKCTSLIIEDVNNISYNRRRSYLIRVPHGMFWTILSRVSINRIQTTVSVVNEPTDSADWCPSTITKYRIIWKDPYGKTRGRRWKPRNKGPQSWNNETGSAIDTCSIIQSRTGRIEINWKTSVHNSPRHQERRLSSRKFETY